MSPKLISPSRVCVVTVTYGDRSALLRTMILSAAQQGVRQVVVFANGLENEGRAKLNALAEEFHRSHGLDITTIHAETNLGPAPAYAHLVSYATEATDRIDAILMLDDDNVLMEGCLDALLACGVESGSLCAVRSDRHYMVEAARTRISYSTAYGEAYGFDLRKKPQRLLRCLGLLRRPGPTQGTVPIPRAPYGGVFVPRAILETVAPPRADFIIYADDYEYTERLAARGGLHLVPSAVVNDQEQSWNASPQTRRQVPNVVRLATGKPDFRLYYALRNALVLDKARAEERGRLWFLINLATLHLSAVLHATFRGRMENRHVIGNAIRDARMGRLGLNPDYPLP